MKVLDAGHDYELLTLDGGVGMRLTFVKRTGAGYPGNLSAYPGTTLQSVLRCCLDRIIYLQNQKPCLENIVIRQFLRWAIWLLEFRGARRHGKIYFHGYSYATTQPMCGHCGHTFCKANL